MHLHKYYYTTILSLILFTISCSHTQQKHDVQPISRVEEYPAVVEAVLRHDNFLERNTCKGGVYFLSIGYDQATGKHVDPSNPY